MSSARRSSSSARRRSARGRAHSAPQSGTDVSSSGRRRSPTSRCCGCCARKGSAPTSPRRASSPSPRAAGLAGDELVVHGNNKDEAFLAQAAAIGAPVVLDAPDEAELAAAAGVQRALVRVTLGVDADTHEAIRTGHHGSKFGLPPEQARRAPGRRARPRPRRARGPRPRRLAARRLRRPGGDDRATRVVRRRAAATSSAGLARVADLGGGFGIRHHPDDGCRRRPSSPRAPPPRRERRSPRRGCPQPEVWLEPGRSLVGRAGVTLYRVGASSACQSARGSRSTAACRTTRGRSSTTPATRRCRRRARTSRRTRP